MSRSCADDATTKKVIGSDETGKMIKFPVDSVACRTTVLLSQCSLSTEAPSNDFGPAGLGHFYFVTCEGFSGVV